MNDIDLPSDLNYLAASTSKNPLAGIVMNFTFVYHVLIVLKLNICSLPKLSSNIRNCYVSVAITNSSMVNTQFLLY